MCGVIIRIRVAQKADICFHIQTSHWTLKWTGTDEHSQTADLRQGVWFFKNNFYNSAKCIQVSHSAYGKKFLRKVSVSAPCYGSAPKCNHFLSVTRRIPKKLMEIHPKNFFSIYPADRQTYETKNITTVAEVTSCAGGRHNMPPPHASWPLTFWPWKWCPSHVWRGLPLFQFWSSYRPLCSRLRPDVRDRPQTRIIA